MTSANDGAPPRVHMHDDEVFTDTAQVRRLLAAQFPRWAELPLTPVRSHGTDNAIYRLGSDMAVRLPRRSGPTAQIDKEHQWLPRLAPHLPLAIPVPLAKGAPGEGYPWAWSVCTWLKGSNSDPDNLADPHGMVKDLAQFILALRAIDCADGPKPGAHNFGRGAPLMSRDDYVLKALAALHDTIDVAAVTRVWEADRDAPAWSDPPLWIHGDLNAGNLLVRDGRLSGVIDFGGLGVGDPACDLLVAWYLFAPDARATFRAELNPDAASWARGRGWALSMALIGLSYYKHTNPVIAANSLRAIDAILAEYGRI